jgi:hypothetical protein
VPQSGLTLRSDALIPSTARLPGHQIPDSLILAVDLIGVLPTLTTRHKPEARFFYFWNCSGGLGGAACAGEERAAWAFKVVLTGLVSKNHHLTDSGRSQGLAVMTIAAVGRVDGCLYGVSNDPRGFYAHIAVDQGWWRRRKWAPEGNPLPTREAAVEKARAAAADLAATRAAAPARPERA